MSLSKGPPAYLPGLESMRLLTARQVARLLGVSVRSIWRLSSSGEIPKPARVGRLARWKQSEMKDYLAQLNGGQSRA